MSKLKVAKAVGCHHGVPIEESCATCEAKDAEIAMERDRDPDTVHLVPDDEVVRILKLYDIQGEKLANAEDTINVLRGNCLQLMSSMRHIRSVAEMKGLNSVTK